MVGTSTESVPEMAIEKWEINENYVKDPMPKNYHWGITTT